MEIFSLLIGILIGFALSLIFSAFDEKHQWFSDLNKLFKHYVEDKVKNSHEWGKWEAFEEGVLSDNYGSKKGRFVYLRRTCNKTGEQQIKKITS